MRNVKKSIIAYSVLRIWEQAIRSTKYAALKKERPHEHPFSFRDARLFWDGNEEFGAGLHDRRIGDAVEQHDFFL